MKVRVNVRMSKIMRTPIKVGVRTQANVRHLSNLKYDFVRNNFDDLYAFELSQRKNRKYISPLRIRITRDYQCHTVTCKSFYKQKQPPEVF